MAEQTDTDEVSPVRTRADVKQAAFTRPRRRSIEVKLPEKECRANAAAAASQIRAKVTVSAEGLGRAMGASTPIILMPVQESSNLSPKDLRAQQIFHGACAVEQLPLKCF